MKRKTESKAPPNRNIDPGILKGNDITRGKDILSPKACPPTVIPGTSVSSIRAVVRLPQEKRSDIQAQPPDIGAPISGAWPPGTVTPIPRNPQEKQPAQCRGGIRKDPMTQNTRTTPPSRRPMHKTASPRTKQLDVRAVSATTAGTPNRQTRILTPPWQQAMPSVPRYPPAPHTPSLLACPHMVPQ